jgi:hypothetical protein
MLRIAHADAAAVMERHPRRAAGVLRSAFRSGQSDTASVPSRMLSVSRFGLATEPVSR